MKLNNKTLLILALMVVLVGGVVRMVGLNKSPPSLGFDEAALGYNAYSLMKTGRDEYGNFLPISLRSFNDFKPALYAYLTIPFIYFGGLNDVTTRMVSAVAGTVSLVFLFLILRKFVKNKWLLIVLFTILSFEPWRLHYSRNAFETNLSMCFFTIGGWFLLNARRKKNLIFSVIFYGLAAYSYHSARLSAPLMLLFWALDPIKRIQKKNFWKDLGVYCQKNISKLIPIAGLVLFCLPIFVANNSSAVLTRFRQENVFNRFYPYAPKEILNAVSMVYYFGGIILGHIGSHISPINFNFRIYHWVQGSPQFIPGMGMLGWLEGVIFLVGFVLVIKRIFTREKYRFLIYWMLAGIAPAAATWTWFHPIRSLNIYPAIETVTAIGAVWIVKYLEKLIKFRWLKIGATCAILLIMFVTIVFTVNNELVYSAYENNGEYQPGGFKEGMMTLKKLQGNYQQVIIDTPHAQSYIFLLFYQAMDPVTVQKYASIRPAPGVEGNLNFNFDKFVFRKIDWPKDQNLKSTIFWGPSSITREEVARVPGAKTQMVVKNVLYDSAVIITKE